MASATGPCALASGSHHSSSERVAARGRLAAVDAREEGSTEYSMCRCAAVSGAASAGSMWRCQRKVILLALTATVAPSSASLHASRHWSRMRTQRRSIAANCVRWRSEDSAASLSPADDICAEAAAPLGELSSEPRESVAPVDARCAWVSACSAWSTAAQTSPAARSA